MAGVLVAVSRRPWPGPGRPGDPRIELVLADLADDQEDKQRVDQVRVHAASVPRGPAPAVRPQVRVRVLHPRSTHGLTHLPGHDYFHSDDPVEAVKFVVSDAVAVLWESVLHHDGFAAFVRRVPEQLIRWEADHGWTRRGYGQVPQKETALAVPLARLLTTPDMWRRFVESYLRVLR